MSTTRVLLIDDEAGLTRLLRLNLEQAGGYEVWTENQGRLAYEVARRVQPDIIFCDIIMPDMSGTEVAAQIKADPALAHVPLIFLTAAVSREEVEDRGGMIGGHAFIAKPVEVGHVIACIEKHVRGGSA